MKDPPCRGRKEQSRGWTLSRSGWEKVGKPGAGHRREVRGFLEDRGQLSHVQLRSPIGEDLRSLLSGGICALGASARANSGGCQSQTEAGWGTGGNGGHGAGEARDVCLKGNGEIRVGTGGWGTDMQRSEGFCSCFSMGAVL